MGVPWIQLRAPQLLAEIDVAKDVQFSGRIESVEAVRANANLHRVPCSSCVVVQPTARVSKAAIGSGRFLLTSTCGATVLDRRAVAAVCTQLHLATGYRTGIASIA